MCQQEYEDGDVNTGHQQGASGSSTQSLIRNGARHSSPKGGGRMTKVEEGEVDDENTRRGDEGRRGDDRDTEVEKMEEGKKGR
ncbi:uncharacterized protein SPSK_10091 [Sporothrix schenckii 1099-18]|uniref:Uncharacterized protein n=1 Tax=Sporothrix schenckii 1099-18 TaxID=1397361 RepID=A0A0F2M450_SPOSC|nr:uncharacterized protein SPSK_10091 [Sporothrix schenckii 1099-18]KJR84422.1 hypothetical protein SPSK_10091 [Sporothrix schenckii 1099-18]